MMIQSKNIFFVSIGLALLQLWNPKRSWSAIVDQFECSVSVRDIPGYSNLDSVFQLSGVRHKVKPKLGQAKSTAGVYYTEARTYASSVLSGPRGDISIIYDYGYFHALDYRSGELAQAAHRNCLNVTLRYEKDEEHFDCVAPSADPFDFNVGNWNRAPIINKRAGFPVKLFNFRLLLPDGLILLSCQYQNTFGTL